MRKLFFFLFPLLLSCTTINRDPQFTDAATLITNYGAPDQIIQNSDSKTYVYNFQKPVSTPIPATPAVITNFRSNTVAIVQPSNDFNPQPKTSCTKTFEIKNQKVIKSLQFGDCW